MEVDADGRDKDVENGNVEGVVRVGRCRKLDAICNGAYSLNDFERFEEPF